MNSFKGMPARQVAVKDIPTTETEFVPYAQRPCPDALTALIQSLVLIAEALDSTSMTPNVFNAVTLLTHALNATWLEIIAQSAD